MSAEVIEESSLQSSCTNPEKHLDRPVSLPFSPTHKSRSGNGSSVVNGDPNTHQNSSSDSPSSDGGLGGSSSDGRTSENEGGESARRRSSGVSSGSSITSPGRGSAGEEGEGGGTENIGTGSLRRQRPVDILVSDGGDLEDSVKARQYFTRKTASSLPLPPPKNGIFKMLSKARLQNLLARIANKDEFYRGLDEAGPEVPPGVPGGGGPQSFEPFEGSPSSQPPSLLGRSASMDSPFYHMSSLVSRDGTTPTTGGAEPLLRKKGGVWTLNLMDGKLFLFKTNPKTEQPLEVDKEEEESELMEGIELAKLLDKMTSPGTPYNYFNLPDGVMVTEVDNPHVTPIYTPPSGSRYYIYRKNFKTMTPTEYVLHRDTVFLVLQEDQVPPIINAVTQDEMIARLEKLADEGTNFPNASFNPVVNIKFQTGHAESASSPNSIAIYFTGKHNKYRYYVTTDKEGQLVPLKKELPLPPDDWTNHLEFSNSFFTPSGGGGSEGLPSINETESEN